MGQYKSKIMTDNTPMTINSSEFADLINAAPVPSPNKGLGDIVDELNISVVDGTDVIPEPVEIVEIQIPVVEEQQDEQDQVMNSGDVVNLLDEVQTNPDVTTMNGTAVRIEIIEQPAANRLRFRFASEGRGAGALQGTQSSASNRTHPKFRIHGATCPAIVIVSCIEHEPMSNGLYRTHPHKLVGRNGDCPNGVYKKLVNPGDTWELKNVGVQCMRRVDIEAALTERESMGVDPFGTGFGHKKDQRGLELNKIRLAFQVYLKPQGEVGPSIAIKDVAVSDIIADSKACGNLKIVDCSHNSSPFIGGKKILLFTEKVSKDDIEVHFSYHDPTDGSSKTLKGNFSPNDVHRQYGIALTTPAFPHFNITAKIEAQMYLVSKKEPELPCNEIPFEFYPNVIEEKKPVIVATRHAKRDRNAIKAEAQAQNVPQEESTGRIMAPPKGFKSGGGNVVLIEPKKENGEEEGPTMSQIILGADLSVIAATNTSMNPPMNPEEYAKMLQAKPQTSNDGFLEEAIALPEAYIDPELMFDEMSNLSKELKANMKLTNGQNSGLETPDVSMEQSRSKTNNHQNDLDL